MRREARPGTYRRTAAALSGGPAPVDPQQYLTFVLDGEVFAIAILVIKEIIEYVAPTEVPMTPPWVRGVINLRGFAVAVIDPALRFGRTATQVARRTCIVIVEALMGGRRQDVGLIVDVVTAVVAISDAQIQPAPPFGAKLDATFIRGVGRIDDRLVIILDANRVVASDVLASVAGGDRPVASVD
jgi:purine-binding chemotaxis protein CheW